MGIAQIPKVIHYCWFGGKEKPALAKRCIQSWKDNHPDFEIKEWNETNFDVFQNNYTSYCYEHQKWAFLTDYVRLGVLYNEGGIYFDTDVEVLKPFDKLLNYDAFFGREGKEINTGLGFGAKKGFWLLKKLKEDYEKLSPENDFIFIPCPRLNTKVFVKEGFDLGKKETAIQDNIIILKEDVLNPFDDQTGVLQVTEDTLSIHWYNKSWMSTKSRLRNKVTRKLHKYLGVDFFRKHT